MCAGFGMLVKTMFDSVLTNIVNISRLVYSFRGTAGGLFDIKISMFFIRGMLVYLMYNSLKLFIFFIRVEVWLRVILYSNYKRPVCYVAI